MAGTTPGKGGPPPLRASLRRFALRLVVIGVLALAVHALFTALDTLGTALSEAQAARMRAAILAALLVGSALLIAVPFVPGIEIGIALLVMRGAEMAPFVYAATLGGLLVAYTAGLLVPLPALRRLFEDLRLARACRLIDDVAPLPPEDRLDLLRRRLPARFGPRALRWRYPLLALVLNIPGNTILGGGGGLCLVAGLSGVFRPLATVSILMLACLPLPVGFWLLGPALLGTLLE